MMRSLFAQSEFGCNSPRLVGCARNLTNSEGWVAASSEFGFAARRSSDCWDRGRPARPRYVSVNSSWLRPSYAGGRDARGPSKSLEWDPDLLDTIATGISKHKLKNRQNRMSD